MVLCRTILRRASSPRGLSATAACRQQQPSPSLRKAATIATTTPASIHSTRRTVASLPTTRPGLPILSNADAAAPCYLTITTRSQHSSTQIKRLFKQNPAKRRIARKQQQQPPSDEGAIPEPTLAPVVANPRALANGWNVPVQGDGTTTQQHPFTVSRTKNKPNHAVGFLPVYSEYRKDGARVTTRIKKVSGDREVFLSELRAALRIPVPKNPREDTVRVRTGGTIEVKGNRVLEVKAWLAGLGF